jgi:hypothetical protein
VSERVLTGKWELENGTAYGIAHNEDVKMRLVLCSSGWDEVIDIVMNASYVEYWSTTV